MEVTPRRLHLALLCNPQRQREGEGEILSGRGHLSVMSISSCAVQTCRLGVIYIRWVWLTYFNSKYSSEAGQSDGDYMQQTTGNNLISALCQAHICKCV